MLSNSKKKLDPIEQKANSQRCVANVDATKAMFRAADSEDTNKDGFVDEYHPVQYGLLRSAIRILKNSPSGTWAVQIDGELIYCTQEILVSVVKGDPRFADKSREKLYTSLLHNDTWIDGLSQAPWHPEQLDHVRVCLLEYGRNWEFPELTAKKKKKPKKVGYSFIGKELKQNDPLFDGKTETSIRQKAKQLNTEESISTRFEWHQKELDHIRVSLLGLEEQWNLGKEEKKITFTDIGRELKQNDPLFKEKTQNAIIEKAQQLDREDFISTRTFDTVAELLPIDASMSDVPVVKPVPDDKQTPDIPFYDVLLKWFLSLVPMTSSSTNEDGDRKPAAVESPHKNNADANSSDVGSNRNGADAIASDNAFGTAISSAMPSLTYNPNVSLNDLYSAIKDDSKNIQPLEQAVGEFQKGDVYEV